MVRPPYEEPFRAEGIRRSDRQVARGILSTGSDHEPQKGSPEKNPRAHAAGIRLCALCAGAGGILADHPDSGDRPHGGIGPISEVR